MPSNQSNSQMSFDDSTETLIRSFERQVSVLTQSMQNLIDSNENITNALRLVKPPVGGASSVRGSGRQATNTQGSQNINYRRRKPAWDPEEQHIEDFVGGGTAPRSTARSNDRTNASSPADSPFNNYLAGTGGASTFLGSSTLGKLFSQNSLASAVDEGADQGLRLPRYGEFNTQDILHLISNATATGAMGVANTTQYDSNGQAIGGFGASNLGRFVGTGAGRVSQVADYISNLVPYTRAFSQITGTPMSLSGQNAIGTQMGYAQGGMNIGPFRVPGININPFSSNFGVSPAMQQGLQNSWQSFAYGLMPGGSSKLMNEMQNSLQQYGWSGSTMRNIAGAWGNVQRSQQYGDIGSPSQLAPVMDQMLRQGGGSISNLVTALEALPDAAKAANQSITQTIDGINNFAQSQVALGSTYYKGFIGGAAAQTSTGLPISVYQAAISSPLGQGLTAEATGVPIPVIGTATQSQQFAGARQMFSTLYKSFKNAGWTNQQAAAFAGQVSGTGLNSQQVLDIINHGGQMQKDLTLTDDASRLQTSIHNLKYAKTPKTYQDAYNEILRTQGKYAAEKFRQNTTVDQFSAGRGGGILGQHNIINSQGWHEAESGAEWRSYMPTLRKDATGAGMTTSNFDQLVKSSKGNIDTLDRKIKDWAKSKANNWDSNSANGQASVQIELSSQAQKLLKFTTSSNKNAANNGTTSVNIPYATSQYPQQDTTATNYGAIGNGTGG